MNYLKKKNKIKVHLKKFKTIRFLMWFYVFSNDKHNVWLQ